MLSSCRFILKFCTDSNQCMTELTRSFLNISDIDECQTSDLAHKHNCHQNASCDNTHGSYRCTCVSVYTGDGVNCTGFSRYFFTFKLKSPNLFRFGAYAGCLSLTSSILRFMCVVSCSDVVILVSVNAQTNRFF